MYEKKTTIVAYFWFWHFWITPVYVDVQNDQLQFVNSAQGEYISWDRPVKSLCKVNYFFL